MSEIVATYTVLDTQFAGLKRTCSRLVSVIEPDC